MRKNQELLLDENGFEIFVSYRYEKSPAYFEEPGNPATYFEPMTLTELVSVELTIGTGNGCTIEILPALNEKQKEYIINQLSYE